MDLFSRRGFIATAIASLAHLFVARQEPKPDIFDRKGAWLGIGESRRIGGAIECDEAVLVPCADHVGQTLRERYDEVISLDHVVPFKVIPPPVAHVVRNLKIEYVQEVRRVAEHQYVANDPIRLRGYMSRYCTSKYPNGEQRCDMLTAPATPLIVVYPVQPDQIHECDIHTVIRLYNVMFYPTEMNHTDGTPLVCFVADTVSFATESKHVGTPELRGKDARQGD